MAGKRHRWDPDAFGYTCLACGMQRFFVPDGGPRGGMAFEYVFQDQPHDRRPRGVAGPPCPGRPEEKKP